MIAAVLAAAVLAAPGLELQLRPPDLRPPRPAAFLAQDLAGGPAAHGWGGEVAAGAAGALLGTGAVTLLAVAAFSNFPCCSWGSSGTSSTGSDFAALAILAAGTEVLFVPLASSLGVKWAGGHGDGNGWRAYGYALGTHSLVLLVAGLINRTALSLPILVVGDLLLMPLAARAGWHHVPPAEPAPSALSFRF